MKRFFILAVILSGNTFLYAYDSAPPGQLFPFPSAVSPHNNDTIVSSPGLTGKISGGIFGSSYACPYGIRELASEYVRGGFGGNGFGLSAGAERFGITEYSEERASVSAGYSGDVVSLGAEEFARRYTVRTEIRSRYSLYDTNLHVIVHPLPFFCLGVRQDCIYSVLEKKRRDLLWPGTALGIGGSPMKGVFISWNYYRSDIGGINSYECSVNLIRNFSVSAGYSRETCSYALAALFSVRNVIISYGLNYHSYLGATHRMGFSISTEPAVFEQVNLPEERIDPDLDDNVLIDLEECTLDELLKIRKLESLHAERIIKWREIMGPVTEKALAQIGCSGKEIEAVKSHSSGLADDPGNADDVKKQSKDFHQKKSFVASNKKAVKKALFIRLVESGVPAAKALRISDFAMNKPMKEVISFINRSTDLNDSEKKKARDVCAQ